MKIKQAKERIEFLQGYVDAYNAYEPQSMIEHAVKMYAELNNVQSVADALNAMGFRKEGKEVAGKRAQVKLISNDVTDMLTGEVGEGDRLHEVVKSILKKNRRRKGIVN